MLFSGTVNADRRHYEQAAAAHAHADRKWFERLITRAPLYGRRRSTFGQTT
jgi:hypothetical protein